MSAMKDVVWDFLESLHPDVSAKILACLDDPADIVRASSASRAWHNFVVTNHVCKHLCLRLFPQLSGVSHVMDSTQQQKHSDVGCSRSAEVETLKTEHRVFSALSRGLTSSEVGECLSEAISASSTDNYPEESVHNTLEPRDRIGNAPSYWSSSGQSNPEVPETLTYKLISDFCVITEINIQPFQAYFQTNSPIYSAKTVRFRMGYRVLSDSEEEEEEFSKGDDDLLSEDAHYVWTYTSEIFPMAQENRIQNFKLPEPVLCIGGIVQIELLGRVQRQEMDGLFYSCMAFVQVRGRPLSPVFSVIPLEPPGKFSLIFNPEAEFSTPPSTGEDPYEGAVTQDMMNGHVRGWEQILNMLRGTLGVDVYDSDDDMHYESDDDIMHHESDDDDVDEDFVA